MIYLRRLPRVCGMLLIAMPLLIIGGTAFLINIAWAGFISDTWTEALERTRTDESLL